MKFFVTCCAFLIYLLIPGFAKGQTTGRIECARSDDYVYLYSSMTTLEVRATLRCNEVVQVTGRYDNYWGVRNSKGEIGYVPLANLVVLKDQVGTGLPEPGSPSRERIHYDETPAKAPVPIRTEVPAFTLRNDTPVRVKLQKTITSATAHIGDPVEFEIVEDVVLDGVSVLVKGSRVNGVIAEAEAKKRFGHAGRLAFRITSLQLANGQSVKVRCYQEASGSSNTSSDAVLPLASGKDVSILQDLEFKVLVDGDFPLKRESFTAPKDSDGTAPTAATQSATPQH